jgi:hypothetical protein
MVARSHRIAVLDYLRFIASPSVLKKQPVD